MIRAVTIKKIRLLLLDRGRQPPASSGSLQVRGRRGGGASKLQVGTQIGSKKGGRNKVWIKSTCQGGWLSVINKQSADHTEFLSTLQKILNGELAHSLWKRG